MYFLAHDPRVPEDVRGPMSRGGLAQEELADNGYGPYPLYLREARRRAGP